MLFVCIGSVSALENPADDVGGKNILSIDESLENQTDESGLNEIIGVDESPEILDSNKGTFTDLAARIDDAIANNGSVLYLPYDFMYNDEIDYEYNHYISPDRPYYGILINETLTINGNNHTISGSNIARIFTLNNIDSVVTFNNITFKDSIGAIFSGAELIINDCTFINNTKVNYWTSWGAIDSFDGRLTITNCTFINNTAFDGGAIFSAGADIITITDSVFTKNAAIGYGEAESNGGAIYVNKALKLNIHNCIFTDNTAIRESESGSFGGAVVAFVDAVITNSIFNNNSAENGGAVSIVGSGMLSNSNFSSNIAFSNGADIHLIGGVGIIQSCTFDSNSCENSAIYNGIGGVLNLSNNRVSSTKAKIYNEGRIISTTNVTVLANKTVKAEYGKTVTLNATFTDDNGNLIYDSYFNFTVSGVANSIPSNYTDNLYIATYMVDKIEEKVISAKLLYDVTTYDGLLDIGPSNDTTIVFAPNLIKYYKSSEKFAVIVTDGKAQPTQNKTVDITINGVTYSRTTNKNGTAYLNINLDSGEYPVSIAVDDVVVNSTVIVKSTIVADDLVIMFGDVDDPYFAEFNVNGTLLINTIVSLNINGVIYNITTTEWGTVQLDTSNLQPGDYIITATNYVTGEMKSNNIKVISLIESDDLTKYYRNASQFVVRILNNDGSYAIEGNEVKFYINGVFYTRTTNATGHAKLNINLGSGNYTITTFCNNCSQVNNITVLPILSAEDLSMKYLDGSQFKAQLVDGQGNPYDGQTVRFNVHGVLYDRVTDNAGQAKLNIRLMPGEYIITSSYNGSNIANKITVLS